MTINVNDIKKGLELRELRKSLKLSQEEFGAVVDYKLNRISVVERKNLPIPAKMHKNLKAHIKPKR